jgi:hypothetical protein
MKDYWGNRSGAVEPRPKLPSATVAKTSSGAVKVATPDLIVENLADIPFEIMQALIFENIGGQEILTISRHDLVNGQRVPYSPIKNLGSIQRAFNPGNVVSLTNPIDVLFERYSIKFEEKLPLPGFNNLGEFVNNLGTGLNGSYIYNDLESGALVIDVRNLAEDEQVEVQIMISFEEFNDTIY